MITPFGELWKSSLANRVLHWTGIPLRSIPASELERYEVELDIGQ